MIQESRVPSSGVELSVQWGKGGLTEDRLRFEFGLRNRPELPVGRSDQDLGLTGGDTLDRG